MWRSQEVFLQRLSHLFFSAYMPGSFIITILQMSKLTVSLTDQLAPSQKVRDLNTGSLTFDTTLLNTLYKFT